MVTCIARGWDLENTNHMLTRISCGKGLRKVQMGLWPKWHWL